MKPWRVALVTATFPPYSGGTGRVCYENAKGLAQLGHHVDVFTAAGSVTASQPLEGVTVHWLPAWGRIGNAPLTPELLRLGHYDIVHLHYPYVFGQEMIWAQSFQDDTRLVITYHQDLILNGLMGTAVRFHHAVLGDLILRRATRLIVTSLDYASASRVAPILNDCPSRVAEVANGVNAQRFRPDLDGTSIRERYGWDSEDKVVIFVGGLDTPHYFKGVDHLIRAVAFIPDDRVKLLIVGDGDLRPKYEALAHSLGMNQRAHFAGHVTDDELPLHYAASDVAVLPSTTKGEAFGIVLLEAMACGKPVIASSLPGVRSVVDHDVNGLLAPPGDAGRLSEALMRLLSSAELRAQMGARGRFKVEQRYDWPAIISRLEDVYGEALLQ
ncbi:MAG: glycosyltransferase family 4 protein [Anaerolineae bacterium]